MTLACPGPSLDPGLLAIDKLQPAKENAGDHATIAGL